MSKKLKTNIISTIEKEGITIRPRALFVLGSVIAAIGVTISTVLGILGIHLLRFRLSHPGLGAGRKVDYLLSTLPWYIPVLAITGLVGGYLLLKRYDFSYRKNFGLILALIMLGLVISSYSLDYLGLDDFLTRRGYFREIYGQQMQPDQLMEPGIGSPQGRGPRRGQQGRF